MCYLAKSKFPVVRPRIVFSALEPEAKEPQETVNPYLRGTLCHELWATAHAIRTLPVEPSSAAQRHRPKTIAVVATAGGSTRLRDGAVTRKILQFVLSNGRTTVDEVEALFGPATRGHLQKLIEANHLRAVK